MNLRQINYSQYFNEECPKKQIYLHHTAGGPDAEQVFRGWSANPEKIATCVVVGASGEIVQGFSSKYWAYHLGLKKELFAEFKMPYIPLDKVSIGLEICCWGQLTQKDGKFLNYVGKEVPASEVCELAIPFKGFKYYHNYTDAQIESVKELLLLWKSKYNIPLAYSDDIFDVNTRALYGTPGLYTHNSVRRDKVDIYPHPKMVQMLKTL